MSDKFEQVTEDEATSLMNENTNSPLLRQHVADLLVENTAKMLAEDVNTTPGIAIYDKIFMTMVKRMAPKLIAYDVAGVQPMTGPTGLIFAMRAHYADATGKPQAGPEALFNEANTAYGGSGTHVDIGTVNPFEATAFATGVGYDTAVGEVTPYKEMGVTIEKKLIEAKTSKLRANLSLEIKQDMQAVHNLDAEIILANICADELVAEENRKLIRMIYSVAKQGADFASTPGEYDMQNDADGRWAAERYKGLLFAIERDANKIARETRRGKGNILIVNDDTASALAMAGILDFAPGIQSITGGLNVDASNATFAGTAGRFKVFVDPYVENDGYVVGYKGGQYDAGIFYAPYRPIERSDATDFQMFYKGMGFMSRAGYCANPFTTLGAGQNIYYRKAPIRNLI